MLCRSGGDRLSRVLRHSTMGAGAFNGRVRDGIGFWAHRSNHQTGAGHDVLCSASRSTAVGLSGLRVFRPVRLFADTDHESDQARSSD